MTHDYNDKQNIYMTLIIETESHYVDLAVLELTV